MSTYVCITTRNEVKTIDRLVQNLVHEHFVPIVIDAASTDGTAREAELAGAIVFRHEQRVTIGDALMEAWVVALNRGATSIIQMDAGGSHRVSDACRLRDALKSSQCDMIVGSRFLPDASYLCGSWWRRLGSRCAAKLCNAAQPWPRRMTDWTSGFRAFRPDALRQLLQRRYSAGMHGWQIEVLAEARRLDLRIAEVPITYVAGRSSFNLSVAREAYRVWQSLHMFEAR